MTDITWQAPEFEYHEKGTLWSIVVIILAAAVVLIALLAVQNFLLAVFAAIAGATVIFWGRQRPRILNFKLTDKAVEIDTIGFHSYGDLAGFAISDGEVANDGVMEVALKRKRSFSGEIRIFAYEADIAKIREKLSEVLPEFEHKESLGDHIARLLRF